MNKQENIESIINLIHDLMLSARTSDPQPWLHLELTKEQIRVLFLLYSRGKLSPGEVAASFGVPKANVTSVLDRLVKKGYINRQENPNDRRSFILSLSKDGKDQIDRLVEISTTEFKRVLEKMSDEGLGSLKLGMESLITAFKDDEESSKTSKTD